jgi:hypothetical protein
MEDYIREICTQAGWSFNEMIQQYNSNKMTRSYFINRFINYKIENNKDIIYKEDILKICSDYFKQDIFWEEFMENVMKDIKYYNLDINNLILENNWRSNFLQFYYISTFLEHEPVDIKIALKD